MPAPYARRDWQTKTDRALNRVGRGSQQGRFPGTRPVPPSGLSRPGIVDYRDSGQLHKIDQFTVTDDATDTFTLRFEPLPDSWNVKLGWPLEDGVDFTISGKTLTVLDPTELFRGIATNGSRTLHVQYDYLTAPTVNPTTFGDSVFNSPGSLDPIVKTFPSPPPAGATVLLGWHEGASRNLTPTGLGATWSLLAQSPDGIWEVWGGTGCDGVNDTITMTRVGGTQINVSMGAIWLEGVTLAGVQDDAANLVTTAGPLTAPGTGGVAFCIHSSATPTSESPSAWDTIYTEVSYKALGPGEVASETFGGPINHAMVLVANV